jgi:hypothetical protein
MVSFDWYDSAERATENSLQACRCDNPRFMPYATCRRRMGAVTIFFG